MPKFTEKMIAALAPEPGRKDKFTFDTECPGLGLRINASGRRTFLVQWTDRATGQKRREVLGVWGAITLEKAREAARIVLGRVAAGADPATERREKKAAAEAARAESAFTLEALVGEWEKLHLTSRRVSYAQRAPRTLRIAFPKHLNKPASALTHQDVIAAMDRRVEGGEPNAARLILTAGRACYGWAVKRRKLAVNPFSGLPRVEGAYEQRDRVLSDQEVGEVWRAAGGLGFPFGPAVRLLLLTAQRREEVAALRWPEISADGTTWTLPAGRVKNGREHVVHLSAPARAVLAEAPRVEGVALAFTTTGETPPSGWSRAKLALDRAIAAERERRARALGVDPEPMPPWVPHDFRRAAVTWMAGNGVAPHVADRILNHASGAIRGVAAVYQRNQFLAERAAALDAWGAHVVACGADGDE